MKWLSLRDKNTEFFHRTLKIRMAKNIIRALTFDEGKRLEDPTANATEVVNFL